MMKSIDKKQFTLRFNLIMSMISLLLLTVLSIIVYSYYMNTKAIEELLNDMVNNISNSVIDKTTSYLAPAAKMAKLGSDLVDQDIFSSDNLKKMEKFTIKTLKTFDQQTMFYFGYKDGTFVASYPEDEKGIVKTKISDRRHKDFY